MFVSLAVSSVALPFIFTQWKASDANPLPLEHEETFGTQMDVRKGGESHFSFPGGLQPFTSVYTAGCGDDVSVMS